MYKAAYIYKKLTKILIK